MLNRALRLLRAYYNLTQVELANSLMISNSYLSEIENGHKTPTIDLLNKYSEVFNIPTSSIILFSESLSDDKKPSSGFRLEIADRVLKLLEWIEDHGSVKKPS